jgi:hypothetical protein
MRDPLEMWPTRKTFTQPPPEECKKDMLSMVGAVRAAPGLWYTPRADTRAKLVRVYGYVYAFLASARRHSSYIPVSVRIRGTGKEAMRTYGPPSEACREAARRLLLQDAQAGIGRGGLEGLVTETRTYDVEGFAEKRIITLGGRQKKYLRVAYDKGDLPVLPSRHPLSRLYLEEAHRTDHAGVDAMIMRNWSHVSHTGAPESVRCEESLLHLQEAGQEVGGAEDGAPPGSQDGANAPLLVHGGGPVRARPHQRPGEQAFH